MACLICDNPAETRVLAEGVREVDCPAHGTYRVEAAAWPRWLDADPDNRRDALGIATRAGETFGDIVPMVVVLQIRD